MRSGPWCVFRRLVALFRWSARDRDMDEEMGFHLESLKRAGMRSGLSESEAERAARRRFGNVLRLKEESHDVRGIRVLEEFGRDVQIGLRMLRKAPGFSAVAILTLALGIGATTAIFTVVNGVLLKPLPFDEPDDLISVWQRTTGGEGPFTGPDQYFTFRDENRVFEDIGAFYAGTLNSQVTVITQGEPERLWVTLMTAGVLPALRVQPVVGRRFTEEDDTPGAPLVAMLSYAYWQRRFGADPAVVGTTFRGVGGQAEIIGVLPPDFALPQEQDASMYATFRWDPASPPTPQVYRTVARLLPGTTVERADADLKRMLPMWVERSPGNTTLTDLEEMQADAYARPLKEDYVGDIGSVLWILLGSVGLVLVIACANVANLFLVRSEGRQQEVAVRTALGAGRGQIARQLLLESAVLGLLGGLAGLGLAVGAVRFLTRMAPVTLPRLDEIAVDPVVVAFTIGISLLSGLLFGLFPVFRAGGLDLVSSLKEGGRGATEVRARHRARHTLVVAQMALALVLLAGSGLMIRSFQALRNVDPGFSNPEEVLTFRIAIPAGEIEDHAEVAVAFENLSHRLQDVPGVTSVGAATNLTMDYGRLMASIHVEGFPVIPPQDPPVMPAKFITEGYFETMQIPLLAGRPIEWADVHARAPVAVVTANFAEDYWGSPAAALGKRIRNGDDPENPTWREIVGVVQNVREYGVSEPAPTVVFWPMAMNRPAGLYPGSFNLRADGLWVFRTMAFAVRTSRPMDSSLLSEVRAAVRAVSPTLLLENVRTLDEFLAQSMARTSFTLVMLAIAAAVALALGVVGIYGVISYAVSQRTHEIGVRMALGADRRDVRRMVLRQGVVLAGVGVAIGLVAAMGLTRFLSSLLYGVQTTDPVTFGAVVVVLTAIALVASYVPASRASRTDPLVALRVE